MKRKEITMTLSEFINYTDQSKLERFLSNNKLKNVVIVSIAVGLIILDSTTVQAVPNLNAIDRIGSTFLNIARKGGYWACLVMGTVNCIKVALQSGEKGADVAKVIFKYILVFACLYLLPLGLDLIAECFS